MADINLGVGGANSATGGYEIENSLKFEPANDEGLHFTPSSTTNTDTFTFSCWFKRTEISNQINSLFGSYTDGSNHALFRFKTDNTLELRFVTTGTGKILVSDMLFRDTSAWYHMVLAVDTTDGTTANRVKVYINGEQITLTGSYPNQNQDCVGINTASKAMNVGYLSNFSNVEFAGYITEAHHIDGSQLAPTDFGEYDEDSGIWKPKAYTGSYGTNGFYLDFESSGSLGADGSGNGNNFTLNNITSADQATDTPTNNFCTLNILEPDTSNQLTYTEGATKVTSLGASPYPTSKGTLGVQNGKWYFELKAGTMNYSSQVGAVGLALPEHISASYPHDNAGAYVYRSNGDKVTQGSTTSYGDAWSTNDIIGVAIDLDNNTLSFYRNNTSQGQAFTGLTETYLPAIYADGTTLEVNFGGYTSFSISSGASDANGYGTFEYAPPSGYYALCTKNLAEYG